MIQTHHRNRECIMRTSFVFLLIAILNSTCSVAQTTKNQPRWDGYNFMLGTWQGVGTGTPGEASGGFTFERDLQGTVLVRKNYAVYPSTADRPGFRHDDLMVVYHASAADTRAMYFDNEGHVIAYQVRVDPSRSAVFLSDSSTSAPRFRMTYAAIGADSLGMLFEIAPPGKPDGFVPYITARAYRVKGTGN